jgi:hypothetical protein
MPTKEQRKLELFSDLITQIERDTQAKDTTIYPFHEWVLNEKIILDGREFSFGKHEYLIEPYKDDHPFQVEIKATQLGLTSKALLRVVYGCRYGNYRGILYLFPSRTDVTDLSKGRLTPLIEDNPENIGRWIMETDSANIKKIWNSFLYLRGMKSKIGLKCHDNKTEVLTKRGWLLFKDCTMQDEFATRSPSKVFMWQKPIELYQYHYNGKMILFKANGFDACVTPNHRMLVTSNQKDIEWFDLAENIKPRKDIAIIRTCDKWVGEYPDFITVDGRESFGMKRFITIKGNKLNSAWESFGRKEDRKINLKDFVAFLGIYAAEGSCEGVASGIRKFGRVTVSQEVKSKHYNDIKNLLFKINSNFKYSGHSFRVGDMGLADIVFPLGDKYTKQLPQWVLNLPAKYLEILWEWALKGDGHVNKKGYRTYATVSPVLAGQMQEILQKCGRSASILKQKRGSSFIKGREIKSYSQLYLVSERKSKISIVPNRKYIDYTDNVYCASVPNSTLYTRRNGYAMWSGNSVPIDFEVFDELDEAPQNAVDMALERMAHSDTGHQLYLSNPTLPDYGIDALFQLTDQQYFLLKCRHCNEYNNLVDTFPDCLGIVKGQTLRICKKCGKELDPAYGEWVAKRPSITEKRGRQYSQLYSQMKASSPESILNKFLTTTNLTDFWNLKIGIAYVDAKNRLSREQVFDCCGDQGMLSESSKGCFMGVDQGSNLHFVIGRSHDTRKGEIVHIGHLKGNNTENKNDDSGWRQLDEFMKRFKIMRCVVDAQPNTKLAREFSERFPGRVFLCYYSDSFKGNYRWDEEKMVVHANRTESLDASHMEISQVNVLLPRRSEVVDEFADHMHNVAKKLIVDEETGSQKYQYFRLGEDHWRHAYNYEKMARDESPELMFPDL